MLGRPIDDFRSLARTPTPQLRLALQWANFWVRLREVNGGGVGMISNEVERGFAKMKKSG